MTDSDADKQEQRITVPPSGAQIIARWFESHRVLGLCVFISLVVISLGAMAYSVLESNKTPLTFAVSIILLFAWIGIFPSILGEIQKLKQNRGRTE